MTSWLPTPLLRFPPFHSEAEAVAVELAHLVLVAHRDQPGPRVTQVLPDLRVTLVNADLPDQKGLGVFRALPDPLVVELEEPRFLDQKALGVPLVLPDQRGSRAFRVLLVPSEQMDNPDQRAMSVLLALRDHRVLLDLPENAVLPVRMQSPLSSTSISPRTRQPRPTARRLMSKTHSDRRTPSRTELATTHR